MAVKTSVSSGGEQHRFTSRDHDGVLVMRGEASVRSAVRPAIFIECNVAGTSRNNRFNRDDQPLGQFVLRGEIRVIGYSRRLMNRAPDAMAAEFPHHMKTAPTHFALHSAADVFGAVPWPRHIECLPERA